MKKNRLILNTKKIFSKAIPLWMVLVISLQSSLFVGILEYYFAKRDLNIAISELAKTIKDPQEIVQILKQKVLPQNGYTLSVTWGDIGKKLLDSGVIDKKKYDKLFSQDPGDSKMMKYLTHSSKEHMKITEANSHFLVNTLWALGLVNKNKILTEGQMKTFGEKDPMQYASTAGWDLGSKKTQELYSSAPLIQLTDTQQSLVEKIASNIYRPCCGNSVAFPDCNHGMAVLGYVELAVKQGLTEKQIYKDVLALNSYWFPQQYVALATYFNQQKIDWDKVDAKLALGNNYSSAQGTQQIAQSIQSIPGLSTQQGGCGA